MALPAPGAFAPAAATDAAGRKNMGQLIHLRWLAVAGQLATILVAHFLMGIALPMAPMLAMVVAAAALNIASRPLLRRRRDVTNAEIFLALIFDVVLLTVQLYLSGGATNPFVSLYLLQVVLGAVLLDIWSAWMIVGVTSGCFALLTVAYRPLDLPARFLGRLVDLHTLGRWICFALVAVLLVMFVTRISRNLRSRDAHLADLRQQAAEEDHIIRMGLLASGAAHELGTPLASLAVILNDWRRMPALAADAELMEEIGEMQAEVQRCKAIVTGILLSAGDPRGEAPAVTTMNRFLDDVVDDWRAAHPSAGIDYDNRFGDDMPIVSDPALKQVIWNVLDNAGEMAPERIAFHARRDEGSLILLIRDDGPGFTPAMLASYGRPYQSTKAGAGRGLGLFLVVNVMRKLGGRVEVANRPGGGADVTLILPLATIGMKEPGSDVP